MISIGKCGICLLVLALMVPLGELYLEAQTSAQATGGSAANTPTTQQGFSDFPGTQPAFRRGFGRGGGGGGPAPLWNRLFAGPGNGAANGPRSNEAERTEAADFIRAHSPNRAMLLDMMRPATREIVLNTFVVGRYRSMKRFESTDPGLYSVLVQQFEVQDQILGDMEQLSHSGAATMATTSPTELALREKIAKLVDLNLQQREERLARLRETVDREQDRLTRDQGRRDFLVDQAYNRAMDDADRLATRMSAMANGGPATQPADAASPSTAGQQGAPAADTVPANSPPHP
jgi:hypothetical protein